MRIGKDNQFNAGVGLLHLARMRAAGWLQLSRDAIHSWDASNMVPKCCAHGDQSVFHMVRWYRPTVFQYVLPRWWNLNKCHKYMNFETHWQQYHKHHMAATLPTGPHCVHATGVSVGDNKRGYDGTQPIGDEENVFVGLVHLGCCKRCTRQHLNARWQALFDVINAYNHTDAEVKRLTLGYPSYEVRDVT